MRVFISHHSADSWVAQQVALHIHQLGAGTFLDCFDVQHGDDFWDEITSAATSCQEILVLFTPAALDRPNIWVEIGMFSGQRKRIISVLYGVDVKAFVADERIPLFLKGRDVVDINRIDSYFKQLAERMKTRV